MSWRNPNSSHKDQIDIFCGIGYGEHQLGIVFITWQKLHILFLGYRQPIWPYKNGTNLLPYCTFFIGIEIGSLNVTANSKSF